MKLQIGEMAKLAGVSVRTLHYYDEIGLLTPSTVSGSGGYRFYDEESVTRLQEILFYRELDFPLKEIAKLLSDPEYDRTRALTEQKHLLTLKKKRLERLISMLDHAAKGEKNMTFGAFDNSEFEKARASYEQEARQKWGKTDAYQESRKKTKEYTDETWQEANGALDAVFGEFAACSQDGKSPQSEEAQALAQKLQSVITQYYYHCTKEILSGLGMMYTEDERFRRFLDRHGDGTAAFVRQTLEAYCK